MPSRRVATESDVVTRAFDHRHLECAVEHESHVTHVAYSLSRVLLQAPPKQQTHRLRRAVGKSTEIQLLVDDGAGDFSDGSPRRRGCRSASHTARRQMPRYRAFVGGLPRACSGAMYAAVPINTLCPVTSAGLVIVGDIEASTPIPPKAPYRSHHPRQSEIEHLHNAIGRNLNIRGLQIAMHDPCSCAASSASAI